MKFSPFTYIIDAWGRYRERRWSMRYWQSLSYEDFRDHLLTLILSDGYELDKTHPSGMPIFIKLNSTYLLQYLYSDKTISTREVEDYLEDTISMLDKYQIDKAIVASNKQSFLLFKSYSNYPRTERFVFLDSEGLLKLEQRHLPPAAPR